MLIYIQRAGENHGPYTVAVIEQYLAEGSLSKQDLAWHEGLEGWRPLEEVLATLAEPDATDPDPAAPESPAVPNPASADDSAVDPETTPPIAVQPVAAVPAPRPSGKEGDHTRVDFGAALTFPFRQENWPARFWWVPLVNFLPPLSWLIMRGWRVDVVRRAVRGDVHPLPNIKDIGKMLADGFILMLMVFLYWLPLTLFMLIFGASQIRAILKVLEWAYEVWLVGKEVSFWTVILEIVTQVLLSATAPLLYWLLCYPIYRMAVLRFAITGRPVVFFQLVRNFRLFVRFLSDMMLLFFLDFVIMRVVRWILNTLLIATGFGVILLPTVSIPAYFWVTAHLFGQIAKGVAKDELAAA